MLHRIRSLGPVAGRTLLTGVLATVVALPGSAAPAAAAEPAPLPSYDVVAGVLLRPRPPVAVLPVRGYHLTGRFGDVSYHWSTVHTGLDFAAASGTPIRAVMAGVVVATGYDGRYGNKTVLRLDDGTELWFCHQSGVEVHAGQRVRAGRLIGYVGSTGNVTGPHLHLEVHPHGGEAVDPAPWLRAHGVRP
ncbi:MAG: M23 family metallopeptidase [Nocardioidaceae bacterium]|nr:M23 family metallopeptidase [Nocardioidaceae bacterium]